jgi:D-alanyl-D-alanine carboxypeptidase/D-alanyl-D-alanine-endopeptidase (penicillin-binding protein 4)
MPASNMKILTSAVAWEQLGPEFTYRTTFVAGGPVRDSSVQGNLLVIGRGDPTVSDHMRGDAMLPLRQIADSLAARGIRRITGRIVAAGDAMPGPSLGYGWSWEDLESSYSAGVDELLFNEGFSEVVVYGGASAGDAPRVETRPARSFPRLRVTAATVTAEPCAQPADANGQCASAGAPRRRRRATLQAVKDTVSGDVILSGVIVAGDSARIEVTHRDPDEAYVAALREALRDRGIVVEERTESASTGSAGDTLFVLQSPPLREILPALMKPSQNQIAEAFLRTLGLERNGAGTADSGRAVVERQLAAWGAPAESYVVRDGSGLSRYDYVTPEAIVHVLEAMRRSPQFSLYYEAMPIAGVDGTVRTRMRGTPAENNVHAKTGSVANVRSLSGYVRTMDGRMLIFSALCNNFTAPASSTTRLQDEIGARLAALRLR